MNGGEHNKIIEMKLPLYWLEFILTAVFCKNVMEKREYWNEKGKRTNKQNYKHTFAFKIFPGLIIS
jgi:hypothetical protein